MREKIVPIPEDCRFLRKILSVKLKMGDGKS